MDWLLTLQTLPLSLLVLVGILVLAVSVAGYALASGRRRQQILGRVDGRTVVLEADSIFVDNRTGVLERLGRGLKYVVPASMTDSRETTGMSLPRFDGHQHYPG